MEREILPGRHVRGGTSMSDAGYVFSFLQKAEPAYGTKPQPPVNLPEIVAQTNMDAQSINRLREEMIKFLRWLSKNTKIYFLAGYEPANQDYIEKTRAN